MKEEKFFKVRNAFRHQMAEMSIKEIRDYCRTLRFVSTLNTAQISGLLDDMKMMMEYKAKGYSTADAWASILRGYSKT